MIHPDFLLLSVEAYALTYYTLRFASGAPHGERQLEAYCENALRDFIRAGAEGMCGVEGGS